MPVGHTFALFSRSGKVNILAVLFSAIFLLLVLHEYLRLACVSIVDTAVSGLSTTLCLSDLVLGEACNWVSQWPSFGSCLSVVAMERRGELHVVNGWATHVYPRFTRLAHIKLKTFTHCLHPRF